MERATKPRKKKLLLILGIPALIFALMAVTNPSEKQHKEAFAAAIIKSHPSDQKLGPAEQDLVDRQIYHNFIIFSTTTDPQARTLIGFGTSTIGFCGKVTLLFTFPSQK